MPQYPNQWTETYTPDNLVAGETQLVSETGTLLAGQVLPRGALLGKITATGKLTLSTSAAVFTSLLCAGSDFPIAPLCPVLLMHRLHWFGAPPFMADILVIVLGTGGILLMAGYAVLCERI